MFIRRCFPGSSALAAVLRATSAAKVVAGFGARTARASLTSRAVAELGLPMSDDPAALDVYRSCLGADGADGACKRLAFLGDAVLYLVATRAAFDVGAGRGYPDTGSPDASAGVYSVRRSLTAAEMHRARLPVIGNKNLAARGRAFGVDDLVAAASCRGPIVNDGRVADAVEALVGASFAVGGLEAADSFVRRRILPADYPVWGRG